MCIYWVLELNKSYRICNYVGPTSIKITEMETGLLAVGLGGDVLRGAVVF